MFVRNVGVTTQKNNIVSCKGILPTGYLKAFCRNSYKDCDAYENSSHYSPLGFRPVDQSD